MAFDASEVSPLGFGCMRWEGRETDSIDLESVKEMIDAYAVAGGNYYDTAWAYPNSEKTLREALVKRYPRDSFTISSKCVCWTHCASEEDLKRQLQVNYTPIGTAPSSKSASACRSHTRPAYPQNIKIIDVFEIIEREIMSCDSAGPVLMKP